MPRMTKRQGKRWQKDAVSLPDILSESDATTHLRKKIKDLLREVRQEKDHRAALKEFHDEILASVVAAIPGRPFKAQSNGSKHVVGVALKLSDWHIGERIKADETEGLNAYNYSIAERGLRGIIGNLLKWVDTHRHGYRIDDLAVFCEGDYVSGDIHEELRVTNEFPLPVQAAYAGLLLGEALAILAGHFRTVTVYEIGADNHGRLTKKPQAKEKTTNNMNYVVYTIANARIRALKNVHITQATGSKIVATFMGKRFLIEHGDNVRSQMGIPFYGFNRTLGREAMRRMDSKRGFDYWSIGHFHVPTILEWRTLVNGSLSGTSEYDHQAGRHAEPAQMAFLVDPKHGVFNVTPFQRTT